MDNNNKTNQGQNDLNKKPGVVGNEKVSNPGQGNMDQGKNLNKTPGQNQKIGQDDAGQRQVSNKPDFDRQGQGQGAQGDVQNDLDKGTKQRPNIDRDSQK